MEVCLLSTKGNFESAQGKGTQRYIYELWKNLPARAKKHGINIEKVTPGIGNSDVTSKISFTLSAHLTNFTKYDIIHIPAPIMFTPLLKGKALVLTTATEFVELEEENPYAKAMKASNSERSAVSGVRDIIAQRAISQALSSDYLIVISTLVREEAVKKGYKRDKIYVVNLGVDGRFSSPKKRRSHKKFTIGYLGALNLRKNVEFAIKAFTNTYSKGLEFKIYGAGPEKERLIEQASRDRRISFAGFASEERIVGTYDSFDAFIFPSLYEGFGLPILEAQARGLPVIIYKGSTMPKEVRKYCIEAKNEHDAAKIIEGLSKNGYPDKLSRKAMQYARSFTWGKCADETIKVYRSISRKR